MDKDRIAGTAKQAKGALEEVAGNPRRRQARCGWREGQSQGQGPERRRRREGCGEGRAEKVRF